MIFKNAALLKLLIYKSFAAHTKLIKWGKRTVVVLNTYIMNVFAIDSFYFKSAFILH